MTHTWVLDRYYQVCTACGARRAYALHHPYATNPGECPGPAPTAEPQTQCTCDALDLISSGHTEACLWRR